MLFGSYLYSSVVGFFVVRNPGAVCCHMHPLVTGQNTALVDRCLQSDGGFSS